MHTIRDGCGLYPLKIMKRTRAYKTYPTPRQRELRFLALSLLLGIIASAVTGLVVYLVSRGKAY
jgi:hypothetical protein